MKHFLITALLLLCTALSYSQSPDLTETNHSEPSKGLNWLTTDTEFSDTLLDWQNQVTEKPEFILNYFKQQSVEHPLLIVSGSFWGTYMKEHSNVPGKFPILSRFPDQHGNTSTSGQKWIINNMALSFTAKLSNWVTVVIQPEYTEIDFPGQESVEFRKAYILLGNLNKSPFYAYFGRNTVDFGLNDGYNPFTHTVPNHFFHAETKDPVIAAGYSHKGLHIVGTLISSGRQFRVLDTEESSGIKNGALSIRYHRSLSPETTFKIGAGYLHSTIYNRDIPHHPGSGFPGWVSESTEFQRNAALNIFGEITWHNLKAGLEYTTTSKKWLSTDRKVSALNIQCSCTSRLFNCPVTYSAVYGIGLQGPSGTEYEKLSQFALGIELRTHRHLAMGIEYIHNEDFVPLVAITHASDSSVATDTLIAGIKLFI